MNGAHVPLEAFEHLSADLRSLDDGGVVDTSRLASQDSRSWGSAVPGATIARKVVGLRKLRSCANQHLREAW